MNLVRWDPFLELEEVSTRLNRLFNEPRGRRLIQDEGSLMAEWAPAVDVQETDGEYLIKADLPEVKKEDVRVELQDGMLCLRGERKQEKEEKGKRFHRASSGLSPCADLVRRPATSACRTTTATRRCTSKRSALRA